VSFAATVLVWLALLVGLLQIVICSVIIFSAGWAVPVVLLLILAPCVPLILMQEVHPWRRFNPVVPATAALLSIAVSGAFYWMVYVRMD
jgi:hypothetical protein